MGKKIILSILVLFIVCLAGVAAAAFYWYNSSKEFLLNNNITKEIHIEKGHSYLKALLLHLTLMYMLEKLKNCLKI